MRSAVTQMEVTFAIAKLGIVEMGRIVQILTNVSVGRVQ